MTFKVTKVSYDEAADVVTSHAWYRVWTVRGCDVMVLCAAGRGDSTTRTGAAEAAQRHRTAQRTTRVVRGQSTQTSPGGDQRTHRPDRAAQQAPQQVRRHFTHTHTQPTVAHDQITAQLSLSTN